MATTTRTLAKTILIFTSSSNFDANIGGSWCMVVACVVSSWKRETVEEDEDGGRGVTGQEGELGVCGRCCIMGRRNMVTHLVLKGPY